MFFAWVRPSLIFSRTPPPSSSPTQPVLLLLIPVTNVVYLDTYLTHPFPGPTSHPQHYLPPRLLIAISLPTPHLDSHPPTATCLNHHPDLSSPLPPYAIRRSSDPPSNVTSCDILQRSPPHFTHPPLLLPTLGDTTERLRPAFVFRRRCRSPEFKTMAAYPPAGRCVCVASSSPIWLHARPQD